MTFHSPKPPKPLNQRRKNHNGKNPSPLKFRTLWRPTAQKKTFPRARRRPGETLGGTHEASAFSRSICANPKANNRWPMEPWKPPGGPNIVPGFEIRGRETGRETRGQTGKCRRLAGLSKPLGAFVCPAGRRPPVCTGRSHPAQKGPDFDEALMKKG